MRTCQQNSVIIIRSTVRIPTVCHCNTVNVGFSICVNTVEELTTCGAGKLAVNNLITMLSNGKDCTPFNDRVTLVTECSADVTGLGTGCCLISESNYVVLMEAKTCGLFGINPRLSTRYLCSCVVGEEQLCIYKDIFHAKRIDGVINVGNNALFKHDFNALCPNNTSFYKSGGILAFVAFVFGNVRFPCANRDRSNDSFTACKCFTCAGYSDSSYIIIFFYRPFSLEAECYIHTLKLPVAGIVKIKSELDFLNLINVGSYYVKPINRSNEKFVSVRIFGYNRNGRSFTSVNSYRTTNPRAVSCIIGNFKFNGMSAVFKCNAVDRYFAVCKRTSYFSAVDISFRRRCIKAGSVVGNKIRYLYLKGRVVEFDGLTVDNCVNRTDSI